jgi:hypothetical protein
MPNLFIYVQGISFITSWIHVAPNYSSFGHLARLRMWSEITWSWSRTTESRLNWNGTSIHKITQQCSTTPETRWGEGTRFFVAFHPVATSFANTILVELDFSILKWEKNSNRKSLINLALEGIFATKEHDRLTKIWAIFDFSIHITHGCHL